MQTSTALDKTIDHSNSPGSRLPQPAPPTPNLELLTLDRDELSNLRREIVWQEYERPEFARCIS